MSWSFALGLLVAGGGETGEERGQGGGVLMTPSYGFMDTDEAREFLDANSRGLT